MGADNIICLQPRPRGKNMVQKIYTRQEALTLIKNNPSLYAEIAHNYPCCDLPTVEGCRRCIDDLKDICPVRAKQSMTCTARLATYFNIEVNDDTTSEEICDEAFKHLDRISEILQLLAIFIKDLPVGGDYELTELNKILATL